GPAAGASEANSKRPRPTTVLRMADPLSRAVSHSQSIVSVPRDSRNRNGNMSGYTDLMLTVAESVYLACVLEATARKPGNVHRLQAFENLTYLDFLLSAAAAAPILGRSAELGVGIAVRDAVRETRRFVTTNTNLGIVLLLAPLAAVPRDQDLHTGVIDVLDRLTVDDSRAVFEAIRLANPGGLGDAPEQDVRGQPTLPLREVMALAADRDLVARQYANGFREVFDIGLPELLTPSPPGLAGGEEWGEGGLPRSIPPHPIPLPRKAGGEGEEGLEPAVIRCHLRLLAANPDSHIARRCGPAVAV